MPFPPISRLDYEQVIPLVLDEAERRLRVDAEVTAIIAGPQEVIISADDDSIRLGGTGGASDLITSTTIGLKHSLDVNVAGGTISGDFTPSGLKVAIKITTMNITDVATPIPAVPLAGRNALVITNKNTNDVLYTGPSNVTADTVIGITSGHEINPQEGFNLDIQDDIILYGRAETGKTILIKVTELA